MQPLFFEPTLEFEKTSAQTQLPEDPNAWPHEVLQELYKQAPYVADFSPHVVMEKVDGEQGYGLGHVEIANQSEIQTATSPEMSAAAGVRQVRVPIVIKDGMLQPFDLLVSDDSKVLPLTETRLRAAIFRPQSFDVTSRTPGDQSMIGQLYPPYRQNMGFGGGGTTMNVGMGKEGSALEQYLTPKVADSLRGTPTGYKGGYVLNHLNSQAKSAKTPNEKSSAQKKLKAFESWATDEGHEFDDYSGYDHSWEHGLPKTAGAFQDFGDQFLDADYLHATEGSKQGRGGKKMASSPHRPGFVDEFIQKHASATVQAATNSFIKRAGLLSAILPTINESDLFAFKRAITDPELQPTLFKNAAAVTPSIQLLLEAPERPKFASALLGMVHPTVVQLKRVDEGYRVKAASHLYWEPVVQTIDRGEAVQRFGEKVVLAADLSGAVTMADGADAMEPPAEEHDSDMAGAGPVTEPGLYKVQTPEGEEVVGYAIPNLIDIDGTALPLTLFTNGSVATVQTDVVGVPVPGEQLDLPSADVPRGRGVFATSEGPDGPQATVPLTISATLAGIGEGEPMSYRAESFSGEDVLVSCQPNIQTVTGTEDGKMLVPAHWEWIPLDKADEVAVESQEDGLKMASLERDLASVRLVSGGGGTYSLRGAHVEKLAHDEREMLGIDDTMFLLAGLGVDQDYGVRKIAEATPGLAPVRVRVGREIKLASDERYAAMERARVIVDSFPLTRTQLFKEAATLGDPTAVDTVLSLGFLNPENLMTFVSYLPVLEDAQAKICDILLASRLGKLIDTPEGAIERSVRSLEAVLEGLKALAFQNN